MVKGVPSTRWDCLFFSFFIFGFWFFVFGKTNNHQDAKKIPGVFALWREKQGFHPGGRVFRLTPANHRRKEDIYMAKSKSSTVKPISIRYTCAPNGDQVGLSHYLMADAKKAK